jgi:uncharacterized FAD-dependent dehydrogenase
MTTCSRPPQRLTLPYDQDVDQYIQEQQYSSGAYKIVSRSLDARGANRGKKPHYLYEMAWEENIVDGHHQEHESFHPLTAQSQPPIIVGAGPAGLFAALRLLEYGIPSMIFERGDKAEARMLKIAKHWRYGEFDPESNVCFGEGGAGLFSDGKLLTRVKSPYVSYVMKKFVQFGAPEEILYHKDPHLGSNKIRQLINKISSHLIQGGCRFFYRTKMDSLIMDGSLVKGIRVHTGEEYQSPFVILATGHSAGDIYQSLFQDRVSLKPKSLAMGFRVEHPRQMIDQLQYGPYAGDPLLGTARYSLRHTNKKTSRSVYSFCMCPGGYVLSSGTEEKGLVVNGMSNYSRHSPWSNAALVVTVDQERDLKTSDILAGLSWQRQIEETSWKWSEEDFHLRSGKQLLAKGEKAPRRIPAMRLGDFLQGSLSEKALPKTSCPSGVFSAPLHQLYSETITKHLQEALAMFQQQLPGFAYEEALLLGPETRTSSPITIERHRERGESLSHQNLYPCGEGAGYAGGITSAAVDGILVAEWALTKYYRS